MRILQRFNRELTCEGPRWIASRAAWIVLVCLLVGGLAGVSFAHVFISRTHRAGAYPPEPGVGWVAAAWLNLPDEAVENLVTAENYAAGVAPDFTFRTDWIDFPAGPVSDDLDVNFATVGDFLDDYIHDVSDPAKLDEPFGNMFIRFSGYLKVTLADETRQLTFVGLPVWVDFGTLGYDGFRVRLVETAYRTPDANVVQNPWFWWGPSLEVMGLYPIEVTWFNRYDADGTRNAPRAGLELFSFHGSDKAWPVAQQQIPAMVHPVFGLGTLTPPWVIYQAHQVQPALPGDFNADTAIDLHDYRWLQICADPDNFFLPAGCPAFDFTGNGRIETDDIRSFLKSLTAPAGSP